MYQVAVIYLVKIEVSTATYIAKVYLGIWTLQIESAGACRESAQHLTRTRQQIITKHSTDSTHVK